MKLTQHPKAPIAKRQPHVHQDPHGHRTDDYHWLRDDSRQSEAVLSYLKAENDYVEQVLNPVKSLRQKLFQENKIRFISTLLENADDK